MGIPETQTPDYVSEAVHTGQYWFGQMGDFVSRQIRERPFLVSSLLVGVIGSIVGVRIAQYQVMQRRRSSFQRAMDTIGDIGALLGGRLFRRPGSPMDTLRYRGEDVMGTTRDWSGSVMEGMPWIERPRMRMIRGRESTLQQMGYALSLVPIAIAFLRNPLVRNFGSRYFSRRMMGR